MFGNDEEVLAHALAWRQAGSAVLLATVLNPYGASPRPAGSMAAIREDGRLVGSVSGGCVENDLVADVMAGRYRDSPGVEVRLFGAEAAEQARLRLPCGNTLRVALEPKCTTEHLHAALDAIRACRAVRRVVRYSDGDVRLIEDDGKADVVEEAGGFSSRIGPKMRALIIGANDLGRYLASLLRTLDMAVTVCDPRGEFYSCWQEPGTSLDTRMPDDVVRAMRLDTRTAVLAVAHDPKLDDLALMEALLQPALYVGALGSHRATAARRERLLHLGLTGEQIGRLRGPVGLDIGSRTPAEIAVSIAADLILVRRQTTRDVAPEPHFDASAHGCLSLS